MVSNGQQVMQMLADLHTKEKKTIILVTHDVELVKYSEKTIRMHDGEISSIKEHKGVKWTFQYIVINCWFKQAKSLYIF